MHDVSELLGERILPPEVRRAAYALASRLARVTTLPAVSDQVGRPGHGLVEVESNGNRREIVFGEDYELLGYQLTLLNPKEPYAPTGTLISWTAYLARQWVDRLPPDAPPIPTHD